MLRALAVRGACGRGLRGVTAGQELHPSAQTLEMIKSQDRLQAVGRDQPLPSSQPMAGPWASALKGGCRWGVPGVGNGFSACDQGTACTGLGQPKWLGRGGTKSGVWMGRGHSPGQALEGGGELGSLRRRQERARGQPRFIGLTRLRALALDAGLQVGGPQPGRSSMSLLRIPHSQAVVPGPPASKRVDCTSLCSNFLERK